MSSFIQGLIVSLVSLLVQEAENLQGIVPNPTDSSWIAGLVAEIGSVLNKFVPAWLVPSVQEIEQLVVAELEKYLPKL